MIFSAHVDPIQSAGIPADHQIKLFGTFLEVIESFNMQVNEQLQNSLSEFSPRSKENLSWGDKRKPLVLLYSEI